MGQNWNKPHSQVLVKMDGSRRMTLRNRKFVKQIIPPRQTEVTMPGNLQLRPQQIESIADPYIAIADTGEHEVPEMAPGPVNDVQ